MKKKAITSLLFCVFCMLANADESGWTSKRGLFVVSYQSDLQPLQINQLHTWVVRIEDTSGVGVTGAEISVDGGMPEHDHGLATRPRVTAELGDGNYRLDGLRFHMAGDWELTLTIVANGKTDTAVVNVTL